MIVSSIPLLSPSACVYCWWRMQVFCGNHVVFWIPFSCGLIGAVLTRLGIRCTQRMSAPGTLGQKGYEKTAGLTAWAIGLLFKAVGETGI
jgi:hypothetical protein